MMRYVKLLRVHQWMKNLLVFSPLLFSEHWSWFAARDVALTCVSLCFLASAAYCVNDVVDREADRHHPTKRRRPVASGEVMVETALLLALALVLGGGLVAGAVSGALLKIAGAYTLLQLSYSILFKKVVIVDILVLSLFLIIRVIAGAVAAGVDPSAWIFICTWFISLMFSAGKRQIEQSKISGASTRAVLGMYTPQYLQQLVSAAGVGAIVCYLLWCNESVVSKRFSLFEILPSSLLVTFAILRYNLCISEGGFDEDPARGVVEDLPIVIAVVVFTAYLTLVMYVF